MITATDVTGIFSQESSSQLFENARAIKATVSETSTIMSHPVEDGTTVSDHKVINPIEIGLSVIIASDDYKSVYSTIKNAFLLSTYLIVQTRSGSYKNMVITDMPHDETPDMFDVLVLALKLKEVKIATYTTGSAPTVSSPKSAKHGSSVNNGKQQPNDDPSSTKKQSILKGWVG